MQIALDHVNPEMRCRLGYMQMPAFMVDFTSSLVKGRAMFVPASEDNLRVGYSCFVEIAQESVGGFEILDPSASWDPSIVSLGAVGSFLVVGKVADVRRASAPGVEDVITVAVGEASFTLLSSEVGTNSVLVGDPVRFVARDLALWDEAI